MKITVGPSSNIGFQPATDRGTSAQINITQNNATRVTFSSGGGGGGGSGISELAYAAANAAANTVRVSANSGSTITKANGINFVNTSAITVIVESGIDGNANVSFTTGPAAVGDAYNQANAARDQANTARNTSNNAYNQANGAYAQANSARDQANNSYNAANNRVLKTGDTMTGTLNINYSGVGLNVNGQAIFGNAVTVGNSNTGLFFQDDVNGFATIELGGPQGGYIDFKMPVDEDYDFRIYSTHAQTEFISARTDHEVAFMGANVSFNTNVLSIDVINNRVGLGTNTPCANLEVVGTAYIPTLNASVVNSTSFITSAGLNVTDQANTARNTANAAYDAANNRVLKSGDTMTGILNVASTIISQNIIPNLNVTYDLGNTTNRFNDLYLGGNSVYIGDAILSTNGDSVLTNTFIAEVSFISGGLNVLNQANSAYDKANAATTDAQNAYAQANAGYNQANTARDVANSSYGQANAAYAQANTARDTANDAYGQANTARTTGNNAYAQANTARDTANDAYGQANTARTTANDAYGQANTARTTANDAYAQANTARDTGNNAYAQANAGYAQANAAYGQANAAYGEANLKLNLTGGTINGSLNVSGNLTITGNTSYINVTTLNVTDPLIFLASNNDTSDVVDIGFVGAKKTGATVTHTGLARDAGDGTYYLFDNLADSGHENNVIDFANSTLAILRANIAANSITLVGETVATHANLILAYTQANNARDQANSARDQANTARTTANDAYGAANTAGTNALNAYGQANSARDQANTARTTANDAYGQANTARDTANGAYGQANTARDQANTARTQANTARDQANTARDQANTARDQANGAYAQANNAYAAANNALSSSGGNVTGNLTVTGGDLTVNGNLYVEGDTTLFNVSTFKIEGDTYESGTGTGTTIVLNSNTQPVASSYCNATIEVYRPGLLTPNPALIYREKEFVGGLFGNITVNQWGWRDAGQAWYPFDTMLNAYGQANAAYSSSNNAANTVFVYMTPYANGIPIYTAAAHRLQFTNTSTIRIDANTFADLDGNRLNLCFNVIGFDTLYDTANAAYAAANAAYSIANASLNAAAGGVITGNLTVNGNLYIEGTESLFNVSTFKIEGDTHESGNGTGSVILLNSNTQPVSASYCNASIEVYRPGLLTPNPAIIYREKEYVGGSNITVNQWGWQDAGQTWHPFDSALNAFAQANAAYYSSNIAANTVYVYMTPYANGIPIYEAPAHRLQFTNSSSIRIDANTFADLNGNRLNLVFSTIGDPYGTANAAANTVRVSLNGSSTLSSKQLNFVNTASIIAYVADNGDGNANVSFTTSGASAGDAYNQANSAYNQANNAYDKANAATVRISANTGSQVTTPNINFINTSSVTVSVAAGDNGNANVSFASIGSQQYTYDTTTTSVETVDSWSATTYRSGKYQMQIENVFGFASFDITLLHDGATTNLIKYGESTFGGSVGTFSSDINGGLVRLRFTATDPTSALTYYRSLLAARGSESLPTDLMTGTLTYDLMLSIPISPTDLNA